MFLLGVCLVVGIDVSKSNLALTLPTTVSQCAEKSRTGVSTLPAALPTHLNKRCAQRALPMRSKRAHARTKVPSLLSDQYLSLPKSAQYVETNRRIPKRDSARSDYPADEPLKSRSYLPQDTDGLLDT